MIGIVVNPNSKKNKDCPGLRQSLEEIVEDRGEVVETTNVDEIAPALERFREDERRYWVADGGDGALHWMINTCADRWGVDEAAKAAIYIPTNGGTVDFVAKAISLRGRSQAIVTRLNRDLVGGHVPREVAVPSLVCRGVRRDEAGDTEEFTRVCFGTALAGYGANFFGPFYESDRGRGPARIVALVGSMFGTAAGRAIFSGPLDSRKPQWLERSEHVFLRPAQATVRIDGEPVRRPDGTDVEEHTVVHCSSLPLNLGGVFRVFPKAGAGQMHVHAGHVSAFEMVKVMPGIMTGREVGHIVPNAYDGPARQLSIECHEDTVLTPCLDGELIEGVIQLEMTMGPAFKMAVP